MSDSSPVAPEVVRKVAALARLRLPEAELPAWTEQLGRILSYISQLERAVESGGGAERSDGSEPGLAPTPLRPDSPVAGGGAEALAENAPDLVHGYGSVPRVVGSSGSSGSSGSTA